MSYQQNITAALDRAYARAPVVPVELRDLRLAVLSDLHRGAGDDADDFRTCAPTYSAALDYYWERRHILAVLGDAEDLWECRPDEVMREYRGSLRSERRYLEAGRYWRFLGNHDEDWFEPGEVERHLKPILGCVGVLESLRLEILDGGSRLGEVYLVHGHQGTLLGDRLDWVSHAFLRAIWRPIQRLTNYRTTTAATDWRLGRKHERAMYNWAVAQSGVVVVAGHTHHPVFPSPARFEQLTATYDELRRHPEAYADEALEQVETDLAFARAQEEPCYVNSGCCSFADGSVTGIEASGGVIRLVRWRTAEGHARRKVLASASLRHILRDVAPPREPASFE